MNTLRNKVQLIGHVGADPKVKDVQSGSKVVNLSIATTERYQLHGEWKEDTQWHNLVLWDKLAERAGDSLHKGSYILVEGRLTHHKHMDTKGEARYFSEIKVLSFMLLDRKQSRQHADAAEALAEAGGLPF